MQRLRLKMLVRNRYYDEEKQVFRISYLLDDIPCYIYEMKTKLTRQASGMQSIISDLEIVESSLLYAMELRPQLVEPNFDRSNPLHLVLRSLTTSCIITYGRCFASYTASARSAQPQEGKLKPYIGEEVYKTHKNILELRNNYAAHAGVNTREENRAFLIFDPQVSMVPIDIYANQFTGFFNEEELSRFHLLATKVKEFIRNHQRTLFELIKDKELNKMDYDLAVSESTKFFDLSLKHFCV